MLSKPRLTDSHEIMSESERHVKSSPVELVIHTGIVLVTRISDPTGPRHKFYK